MISQVLASCATTPPDGQPCNDTVALGPVPDWVWLVVLGVGAVADRLNPDLDLLRSLGSGVAAADSTAAATNEAVRDLVEAVNALGADSSWILRSLTEYTRTPSSVRPSETNNLGDG